MQFDPSLSLADWRDLLRREAAKAWGEGRLQPLEAMLEQTATALHRLAQLSVGPEEEPHLLVGWSYPYEEA